MSDVTCKLLLDTIIQEKELYRKYLDLCFAIREYAQNNDYEKLREGVTEQEKNVAAITELEGSRGLLVEEFSERHNLDKKLVTLKNIADKSDRELKDKLYNAQEELKALIREVKKENKVNSVMIGQTLDYIRGSFEIITGVNRKRERYNAKGRSPEDVKVSRNLLNRVV